MAFRIATTGAFPGPVFLEAPLDVLMNFVSDEDLVQPTRYRTESTAAPDPRAIEDAARLLDGAKRPVAIVGSQLRWSRDREALARFVSKYELPVYLNGLARGALDRKHSCMFARSRRATFRRPMWRSSSERPSISASTTVARAPGPRM